ncbi:MAG: ABC transporter substrate-binding protein [Pusillimonas sp.]|nr:ABC transporter substrate-binding protein [Pusillimonas sp.]
MKKKYLLACALTVSLIGHQAVADVKIGFTGALSGPAAALGQDQYDGFMLAVERNNGKLGGETVEVIREDDQVKPEIGLQAARKLIDQDNVDAIVGMGFTNVLMAMLPPIRESGVVAIATNSGPLTLSGAGCQPNVFSTAWQSDGPAEAMGVYAQKNNFNNVYLMAPNYQAGKEMLAGFKRFYKGEVVDEVYTPLSQTDFSAEITMLQASAPEAVFVFYPGGLGINFVKQMRQAGMLDKVPVLSVFTVDGTTLPALKGLADGVIAGAMWDASLENEASEEFVKAYKEKYGRVPSLYSAAGYDAANLLGAAIESVDGDVADNAKFAAAVKEAGANFESVRGPFKFNDNNMPIQNFYAFQAVKTGDDVAMKHIDTPLESHKDAYHAECKLK